MHRVKWKPAVLVIVGAASLCAADPALTHGSLTLSFSTKSAALALSDREAGLVLRNIEISPCRGKPAGCRAALEDGGLTVTAGAIRLRASIQAQTVRFSVRGGPVSFAAVAEGGQSALPGFLKDEQPRDRGVLVTRLGPAGLPGARSVFDPKKDLAITVEGEAAWNWRNGWVLSAQLKPGAPLSLRIRPHYYRDELGILYYSPIQKPARWQTAPAVAMTWYGIGYGKKFDEWFQSKEWLYPQIDWVAENLLPYNGAGLVFQLDDNYTRNDDRTMREISDYIRGKGLVPGVWFTPFVVAPRRVAEEHGDWFLHDAQGKILKAFGGLDYGWKEPPQANAAGVLNPASRQAMEEWFSRRWRHFSEEWNFDFFKIDGQPPAIEAFRKAVDGGGMDGYRAGLRAGRAISGADKFINACAGTRVPVEAIGYVNGSRTGPDTGAWPHDCDVIIGWNFLNNVAWYSDPDATANQHRANIKPVRLNAQARVLTGQQFLTDDVWTAMPPASTAVWQKSLPSLDIRPANLYPDRKLEALRPVRPSHCEAVGRLGRGRAVQLYRPNPRARVGSRTAAARGATRAHIRVLERRVPRPFRQGRANPPQSRCVRGQPFRHCAGSAGRRAGGALHQPPYQSGRAGSGVCVGETASARIHSERTLVAPGGARPLRRRAGHRGIPCRLRPLLERERRRLAKRRDRTASNRARKQWQRRLAGDVRACRRRGARLAQVRAARPAAGESCAGGDGRFLRRQPRAL